jgi:NAD(P)-dependent dehydrogenase (short-subunit alcohol dehydrogenase family)
VKTLADKVVVITGAGSGIGRALACAAAAQGAQLALCDQNAEAVVETAKLSNGRALAVRVDVRSDTEMKAFAGQVEVWYGGADVLVNNAGVSLTDRVENISREDFAWLFDINFWGVVRGTEYFLPLLRRSKDAHLVNVSSVFGLVGVAEQAAYSASKFAVRGDTQALAQELHGTSLHVTTVHPGGVKTQILRNGRGYHGVGEAEKAAAATFFEKKALSTPEVAASRIWRGVLRNSPRVLIGADAWLLDLLVRWFPSAGPGMIRWILERATVKAVDKGG